jgi:cell division protein FtsN
MATKNRRALELKLGKLGIILFVSGMSLLLFGMFLLGIVVGKHLEAYPERYSGGFAELVRERLSWLTPQKEKSPQPDVAANSDNSTPEETFDLTFYKTLGDKKDKSNYAGGKGTNDNRANNKTVVPEAKDKAELHLHQNDSSTGGESAGLVSEQAEAGYSVSMTPEGSTDVGMVEKKGFFEVQAAAYRDVSKAEKIINKLKHLGFTPRIVPKEIPNKGKWFRVIAGNFANRQDAEAASLKIAENIAGVKCVIRYNNGNGT